MELDVPEYDATRWSFWDDFVDLCSTEPEALKESLQRADYIKTYDFLASNNGPYLAESLRIWRQLGEAAGLNTTTLHAETTAARETANRGIVGCSWARCPVYLQESRKQMHWCPGCNKTVLYCGVLCQQR